MVSFKSDTWQIISTISFWLATVFFFVDYLYLKPRWKKQWKKEVDEYKDAVIKEIMAHENFIYVKEDKKVMTEVME